MKRITAKIFLSLYSSVFLTVIGAISAFGQTLVTKTAVLEDLSIAFNVQSNFSRQSLIVPSAFVALTSTDVADLTALPVILPEKLAQQTVNLVSRAVRFSLTCGQEGFQDYFAPEHWKVAHISGDGGVDVTGAPESKLLVQTTNDALVEVANLRDTRFSVVIPVDGYVSFRWRAQGGSYFSPTAPLLFAINAKQVALSSTKQGFYLQAGDVLTWELNPAATLPCTIVLDQWNFSCDATEILVREWYQPNTDMVSHRAYLALVRPELTSIQFPADGAVTGTPDPARSGFPFIDCDGNPYTTADQLFLNKTTPALAVYWEDVRDEEQLILYRHWTIEDKCGNNVRRHIQKIQLVNAAGSPLPTPAPSPNDHMRLPRQTPAETDHPSLKLF